MGKEIGGVPRESTKTRLRASEEWEIR